MSDNPLIAQHAKWRDIQDQARVIDLHAKIAALESECAGLRKKLAEAERDAKFGDILFKYIDRLQDPDTCDTLEKIVGELSAAVRSAFKELRAIDAAQGAKDSDRGGG